jgi:hypothetical protein
VNAIHDEDRDRVLDEWTCAASEGREAITEFRIRHVDTDVVRYVRAIATPVRNPYGRVVEFLNVACVVPPPHPKYSFPASLGRGPTNAPVSPVR